ncbi:butyrophilin subfamily 3 member A2-like [Micropterus salmoides]|uniref:butyrophilin subfamily 3 member A2-like n=1 Tax=Micropterus salmoides TaxID=27706 RepID=UPI0018EA5580|nr:butyrophilin subfamily 3 member A2-like [Micropterus salmoides]
MFNLQMIPTAMMKLLPLLCLCLLTRPGRTFVDKHGPVTIKVKEDGNVILPCSLSTKENIESELFDWKKDGQKEVFLYVEGVHSNNGLPGQDEQFKGRVSHFEHGLQYGDASLIIKNTKVSDSGNYTCNFPDLQQRQIFFIQLVVGRVLKDRSGGNISGAAPKPYVTTLDQTENRAVLQCEVRGAFPKPKVEWKNSAGNKLPAEEPQVSERGGSFYIILQTTVMKTDRYRCVATQEEISHQIHTETFIYIHGFPIGFVVVVVIVVALLIGGWSYIILKH